MTLLFIDFVHPSPSSARETQNGFRSSLFALLGDPVRQVGRGRATGQGEDRAAVSRGFRRAGCRVTPPDSWYSISNLDTKLTLSVSYGHLENLFPLSLLAESQGS